MMMYIKVKIFKSNSQDCFRFASDVYYLFSSEVLFQKLDRTNRCATGNPHKDFILPCGKHRNLKSELKASAVHKLTEEFY